MTDASEKLNKIAHLERSAEITRDERERVLNAITNDWKIASRIAERAGLSTSKTGKHLQYWYEKGLIEKRPVQSKLAKRPTFKTGGSSVMHPQYEYRHKQVVVTKALEPIPGPTA